MPKTKQSYSVILGTGMHDISSDRVISNESIQSCIFFDAKKNRIPLPTPEIVTKFEAITGIRQRHYAANDKLTSTLGIEAGENAINSSGINRDEIDCVIFAHNFGDVATKKDKVDSVPTFASRIKNHLKIENPAVIAYDIAVGGNDALLDLKLVKEHLGLNSHDLVLVVHDYETEAMLDIAEEQLRKCPIYQEQLHSIVVIHFLGKKQSLARKVQENLHLNHPNILVYDLFFGCPGFLQATIQADALIKDGKTKKALIIGAEILSRVAEKEDRDYMIYADGAGAIILGTVESSTPIGILSHKVRSDTIQDAFMITMGNPYNPNTDPQEIFLKMLGTRVHRHALSKIPSMIKEALEEAGLSIQDIAKMVCHQPNPLMLEEIARRTFELLGIPVPEHIMPIIGDTYGNPSVASIPMILDLINKGKLENHTFKSENIIMFMSIGAGMNINIVFYKVP